MYIGRILDGKIFSVNRLRQHFRCYPDFLQLAYPESEPPAARLYVTGSARTIVLWV